jgi:hypothetical protein
MDEKEIKRSFEEMKEFVDDAKNQLIREQAMEIITLKLALKTGINTLARVRNDLAMEARTKKKPIINATKLQKIDYKHDLCKCGNVKLKDSPVCRKCWNKNRTKKPQKKKRK